MGTNSTENQQFAAGNAPKTTSASTNKTNDALRRAAYCTVIGLAVGGLFGLLYKDGKFLKHTMLGGGVLFGAGGYYLASQGKLGKSSYNPMSNLWIIQ